MRTRVLALIATALALSSGAAVTLSSLAVAQTAPASDGPRDCESRKPQTPTS